MRVWGKAAWGGKIVMAAWLWAVTAVPLQAATRINCGGGAYRDVAGQRWAADVYFQGGSAETTGRGIAGCVDDPLFQSSRTGRFSYRIPVATGEVDVVLHFAELSKDRAGQRVVDVYVEGALIVGELDTFKEGGRRSPVSRSTRVRVTDGAVDISFGRVAGKPALAAIEVIPVGETASLDSGVTALALGDPGVVSVARIHCGGGAYTDTLGRLWSADIFFSGGLTYSTAVAIGGTVEDALYQSERNADFSYSIPLTNGAYEVVLHFAEIFWTSAGVRRFDVLAEGATIVTNLDVWQSVGANTALELRRNVTVADGALDLQFVTQANRAKVSAIEVLTVGTTNAPPPPPATPVLTVTPATLNFGTVTVGATSAVQTVALGNSGTASLTVTNVVLVGANAGSFRLTQSAPYVLSAGQTTTVSVAFAPATTNGLAATLAISSTATGTVSVALSGTGQAPAPPPPPPATNGVSLVRIHSGGGVYTDTQGRVWSADTGFVGGLTYGASVAIAGTVEDPLYQSERFGDFSYQIPLTNGAYDVVLHFAEIFWTSAGARRFNVLAEGATVVTNLDIWATVGANTALELHRSVTVADGVLNVQFVTLANNAKVSAIEVLTVGSTNAPPPPPAVPMLTVTPAMLNFGTVTVGATSAVQTVALGNSGTASLTVTNVVLVGANAGSYRLTQSAPYVLSAGQTTTVSVAFAPATTNALAATLAISSTATGTVSAALSGTGQAPAAPPSTNSVSLVRIHSGGGVYTDTLGRVWSADVNFTGGLTYGASVAIAGTVEDPLYQSERFGDFAYQIPLTNGAYEVVLHFAEIFWTSAGSRRFNVLGEGALIVTNLDIWATAGANTALQLHRNVTVADGILNLQFVSLANNAKVSAIEVLGLSTNGAPPPPPPPPSSAGLLVTPSSLSFGSINVGASSAALPVSLVNTGAAALTVNSVALSGVNAGQYVLTQAAPYVLNPGQTATVSVAFAPDNSGSLPGGLTILSTASTNAVTVGLAGSGLAAQPAGAALYRVNAGGGLYTDSEGNLWIPDGGLYNTGNAYSEPEPIAGTAMDPLYQSERWDFSEAPEMTYSFPVPAGSYRVRLHFAEIFSAAAVVGGRVFGVEVENVPVLTSLDVFAEAGFATALIKEIDTFCADGVLEIVFRHEVENPKISAIEILAMPAVLSATPEVVDWGHVLPGATSGVTQVQLRNTGALTAVIDTLTFRVNAGLGRDFVATINGTSYNGGEAGATHVVNISLPPGATQTVNAVYAPSAEGEGDVWLDVAGNFATVPIRLHGEGGADDGHPFLHVVIKVPAYTVDFDGDGQETIRLDGTDSHTHELGHVLQRYEWRENGVLIGTNVVLDLVSTVGTHTVSLTIFDDHLPPETLVHSTAFAVVPANAVPGALALYYDAGATNAAGLLDAVPVHADFGERPAGLRIDPVAGRLGGSPFTGAVMVVLSGQLNLAAGTYAFQFAGGSATRQFLDGTAYTGPRSLNAGMHRVEGRFAVPSPGAGPLEILMGVNGATPQAIAPASVTHDEDGMLPVLNAMPPIGLPGGGNPIVITGLGFVPPGGTTVHWGGQTFAVPVLQVLPTEISFTAPPGATGSVPVYVSTPAGTSRTVMYVYSDEGPAPVAFAMGAPVPTAAPTQATWGPDGRLYVASLFGMIAAFTFDDNYNVISQQVIGAIADLPNANILGLTFNPHDAPGVLRLYVAHSQLYAHGGSCFDEYSAYNGQVSVLTGPAFDTVEALITGLPVSNHDHGINGLEFDNNGDLLIAVGGNSNAGVPGCNIGGLPESPLTAAVLKAATSKPGFNGVINYIETATGLVNMDQRAGGVVDVAPGVDIGVFAAGLRNPFDLTLTAAGRFYCTDNGPNDGFGAASMSATTEGPDPTDGDTLNLLEDGHYYGHANRNRGRRDSRQDVYTGTAAPAVARVFSQGLAVFPSSVNGIVEYRAQAFNGAMRGDLLMQKWGAETYRATLTPDGRATAGTSVLPVNMQALDLVTGPGGVLIGTDYDFNALMIAQPVDVAAIGTKAYDIFPWRAPAAGGKAFVIGGSGFGSMANTTVTIGGTPAVLTSVSATRIHGVIPARANAGKELLDVRVAVGAAVSTLTSAFRYLTPPGTENSAQAALEIDSGTSLLHGTTWLPSAFKVSNLSGNGQKLERIEIDVSTTVLPDQLFDPEGTAGDNAGKFFTVDTNAGVGSVVPIFLGAREGGYERMAVVFGDFAPGGQFGFSIDVDGTSILGSESTGPSESGSNAGLELAGAGVTFVFSDGTTLRTQLFSEPTNTLVVLAQAKHGMAEAPVVSVLGVGAGPATVTNMNQMVRITARAGSTVDVVVAEGALYTNGVPGAGNDLDPYEDNSLVDVRRYVVPVGVSGTVDVAVTLSHTEIEGGYNHIMAVERDDAGQAGAMAPIMVLYYAPPVISSTARATFTVDSGGTIASSSTYVDRSFRIANTSTNGQRIQRVVVDLRTAIFPDMVFDPVGTAGDPVGKGFTVDTDPGTGLTGGVFQGARDGGYDLLDITFTNFTGGKQFEFSVDVDPTSVKGAPAPGPGEAASVSGFELMGASATITFSDGAVRKAVLFGFTNSVVASTGVAKQNAALAPVVTVTGVGAGPAVVTGSNQLVHVVAAAGSTVDVLVVEGALWTNGVAGGGFDIDPYEANSAVAVRNYRAVVGGAGSVDVQVSLSRSSATGGLNHIVGVIRDSAGQTGASSLPVILVYTPGGGGSSKMANTLALEPRLLLTTGDGPVAVDVRWPSVEGRRYIVYEATNLLDEWMPVYSVDGTGDAMSYPPSNDAPAIFYRVVSPEK